MMRIRFALLLAASTTALVACDGNKATTKGTATSGDFCQSLLQSASAFATRCFGGGESYWVPFYSGIFDCDRLAKDIAGGRIVYNQSKAARCLEQIASFPCDSILEESTDCTGALVGQVPSGGACPAATLAPFPVCAPDTECSYVANSCTGICKSEANAGAPCGRTSSTEWVNCIDGFSCDSSTHTCVADAGEGEACLGPRAIECRNNLVCESGTGSTPGTCRRKKTAGSCTGVGECASGYVCSGDDGAKTCQRAKLPGDSCTPGRGECLLYFSWCGSDGKCTDSRVRENATCGSQGADYIQCEAGLYCATTSSGTVSATCRKETPAGSPCTSSTQCSGIGSYCDSTTKLCVACE